MPNVPNIEWAATPCAYGIAYFGSHFAVLCAFVSMICSHVGDRQHKRRCQSKRRKKKRSRHHFPLESIHLGIWFLFFLVFLVFFLFFLPRRRLISILAFGWLAACDTVADDVNGKFDWIYPWGLCRVSTPSAPSAPTTTSRQIYFCIFGDITVLACTLDRFIYLSREQCDQNVYFFIGSQIYRRLN